MWKVSQNPSNPDFETCKTCATKYPECTTCKKYQISMLCIGVNMEI